VSAGTGAKGHRLYDWAFLCLDHRPASGGQPDQRWLMIRRHRRTGELAFYRCDIPGPAPLATLVWVARQRWRIEECFQTGKGLVGLDQHQVRRWRSWYGGSPWPWWPTPSWWWRPLPTAPASVTGQVNRGDLQRAPAPSRGPGRPTCW
jgi:hypothetical protein